MRFLLILLPFLSGCGSLGAHEKYKCKAVCIECQSVTLNCEKGEAIVFEINQKEQDNESDNEPENEPEN